MRYTYTPGSTEGDHFLNYHIPVPCNHILICPERNTTPSLGVWCWAPPRWCTLGNAERPTTCTVSLRKHLNSGCLKISYEAQESNCCGLHLEDLLITLYDGAGEMAGVIKQIHMINFMCHDNFNINLNRRINFICGRNGSGKSAIQTAVVVGLGGKAAWTGRGASLKDLVKNGKTSCTIKITLTNCGYTAYNPEIYGDELTVERQILLSGSSSYKIKNEAGVVLTKLKDELDKILFSFNIQINNPIAILHQDVARSFLNSDDPKKKYLFFTQATLFDNVEEHHTAISCNTGDGHQMVEQKEQALEEAFEDIELLRHQIKTLQEAEVKVQQREQVRNELSWAKVYEEEALLNNFLKQKEKILLNIDKLNTNLERCNVNDTELIAQKRNLEQQINEIQEDLESTTNKIKTRREMYREKSDEFESTKEELKQSESKLIRLKARETAMEEMIYEATHPDPEIESKRKAKQSELEKLKEKLLDVDSVIQTSEVEYNQLVETQEQQRIEVANYNSDLNNNHSEQSKRHINIKTLKQESNNLSMYSNFMPALVAAVNAEKRFKEKPHGPIGAYIKVKEPAWAAAVENFIGRGILSAFCVSNQNDYELLQRIMNRVCPKDVRPTIFNSKFFYQIHNVQETKLYGYSNLLRGLEIADPVIANCLIDNLEIETVIMIATNEEAFKIMGVIENVPQYCKRAFTLKADIFYPAPNYKSYNGKMRAQKPVLLQVDNNDTIRVLEEELKELVAENKRINKLKGDSTVRYKELQSSVDKIMNHIKHYRKQKQHLLNNIRQMEEGLESESVQSMLPTQMENEVEELQKCIKQIEDKIKGLKENLNCCKPKVEELQGEITGLEEILATANTEKSRISYDICKIESQLRNKNMQQAQYQEKLTQHQALLQKKEKEIDQTNKKVNKLKAEANILAPEAVETIRTVDEITEELSNLEVYLDTLENVNGGDLAQVTTNFLERERAYNEIKVHLENYRDSINETNCSLKDRIKTFKRRQKQIAIIVSHTFDTYLSGCNFKGELQFDHKAKELHINVSPKNESGKNARSTASLSGGEKSYSTAAFIMSLWSHLHLPFYFLDEFDVFMDMVNRDRIMELLIHRAQAQLKQFVFLTPLDMSKVAPSKDLQVFRLNAPRGREE